MKNLIPKKSIFGFKILNTWESIFSSYFLLVLFYLLAPKFGSENIQKIAEDFFLLILNGSLLILTFNSLFQKNKSPFIIWMIFIIPLLIIIPFEVRIIFYALKNLLNLNG